MIFCSLDAGRVYLEIIQEDKGRKEFFFPIYGKLSQGSNRSVERGEFCRTSKLNCQDYRDGRQYPLDRRLIE